VNPVLSGVLTLAGIVVASVFTYLASTRNKRTDAAQQMIDQHQEDLMNLRVRVVALERIARIQGDYIGQLRRHIADGEPPPPPSWPTGLIT
jgi:uncharacterized membrane protein YgaE (UPF0421/DUF939 family)